MSEQNDEVLVKRCMGGDRGAFEVLVEKYQGPLFNLALRMTQEYADAEDITQSVFLKAYESLSSFKPGRKFFSWLYRIAVNETLNFLRGRRYQEPLSEDTPAEDADGNREIARGEASAQIEEAMMKLSVEYRAVVVLKHLQELPYADISQILDIPVKTVKSRLFSARMQMREILVQKGVRLDD
ncbi:sigma-70 family RNA polymerase sigma factor [bacterium]|nr:MAG: sigma-70 family RNA polymerase sigma factor [bacterium]